MLDERNTTPFDEWVAVHIWLPLFAILKPPLQWLTRKLQALIAS